MKIEDILAEVVKRLKNDAELIILFGSYAWGKPNNDSDLDIYIVTKDNFLPRNWNEKKKIYLKIAHKIEDILEKFPIDLIVHTKKMHQKFLNLESSFSKNITNKGKILWQEKSPMNG